MNWSELPSLTSLRAFSALAERKSSTEAAAVLNVSHAAVSQQVKALEERLGLSLVTRLGRGICIPNRRLGIILSKHPPACYGQRYEPFLNWLKDKAETVTVSPDIDP